MSKQKAIEFLKFLESNKEFQEKMSGFTQDEFDEASKEVFGELSDSDLSSATGGGGGSPFRRARFFDFDKSKKK